MSGASSKEFLFRGEKVRVQFVPSGGGFAVKFGDVTHEIVVDEENEGRLLLSNSSGRMRARVAREKDKYWVWLDGSTFEFQLPSQDTHGHGASSADADELRAPMPGTLVKLMAAEGDRVEIGQVLAILEAMKMEHQLRAPRAGTVERVFGTPGAIVDAGAIVIQLAADSA